MQTRIVVGVDDSDNSLIAVDAAAGEAALRGRPLHILHADPFGRPPRSTPMCGYGTRWCTDTRAGS
jgi:nucleotide-binding universal stress UspA family protein